MSTLEEIKSAIAQISPDELAAFRAWFAEFDASNWDRQLEADVTAGRHGGNQENSLLKLA